jgi:hypothetical protein
MMNFGSPFRALKSSVVVGLFVLCLTSIPLLGAPPDAAGKPSGILLDAFHPVLSDFNSDSRIDLAMLRHNGSHKTIHISFGRSSWTSLSFESNTVDRGALVASDINHDGDADLVWVSSNADRFIAWLGDGRGNFSVSRSHDMDSNPLESLWYSSNEPSVQPGNGASPTAILTSTSWNACNAPRYDPSLLQKVFRFQSTTLDESLIFVPVLQLRGPPSL